MFFSDGVTLGRILVVGVLTYLAVVFLLRLSGKRTLSKMNAFDFVVTVALGSTLATILLSKEKGQTISAAYFVRVDPGDRMNSGGDRPWMSTRSRSGSM